MVFQAAVIGTGPDPSDPSRDGYAMGYRHGQAYRNNEAAELVACADIVPENGQAFAREFGIDDTWVYEDYELMVTDVEPDIVSICVPPAIHADIVVDCAESGAVSAIHCEKPMAETWSDCNAMVRACDREGVQLTINHQRRFGAPFREAKRLLESSSIGTLQRMEVVDDTLFDAGTHLFDLCQYFTDEGDIDWVLAQVDYREENVWFGTPNTTQAIAQWRYADGTEGLARTGESGSDSAPYIRLVGDEGTIEIGVDDGPTLRVRHEDSGWETIDTHGENIHGWASPGYAGAAVRKLKTRLPLLSPADRTGPLFIERAIADTLDALASGREPELSGERALKSTELIFASWESANRRGRIDLPLTIDGNPLKEMIDSGVLGPAANDRDDAADDGDGAADDGDGAADDSTAVADDTETTADGAESSTSDAEAATDGGDSSRASDE